MEPSPGASRSEARERVVRALTIALPLVLAAVVIGVAFAEPAPFGIQVSQDAAGAQVVTIRDLPSNLSFAHAFWTTGADYTVASHLALTSEWAGQPVGLALPFGYSPTFLWLLLPFTPLPLVWGFAAWTALNAVALSVTLRASPRPVPGLLLAISPLCVSDLALGQTALLSLLGLLFLARAGRTERGRDLVLDVLVLWALTAKPPLAVVAGTALLAQGRWRTTLLAVGLTLLTTLALTPRLGWGWPADYVRLVTHYDTATAAAAFNWAFPESTLGNLRGVLDAFGVRGAGVSRATEGLWLLALVALVAGARTKRVSPAGAWIASLLAYLLFCPHVSATEDLQLLLLLVWLAPDAPRRATTLAGGACVAIAFLSPTARLLPPGAPRAVTVFAIKLGLAAWALGPGRAAFALRSAPARPAPPECPGG